MNKKINLLQKYFKISIIIFFILFGFKHSLRIYKNYNDYKIHIAWPHFLKKEDTKSTSKAMKLNDEFAYYLLKNNIDGCSHTSSPCTPYPVKNIHKKTYRGYDFFLIKN